MKTSTLLIIAAAIGIGVYYITTKDKKQAVTAPQAPQPGNAPAAIGAAETLPQAQNTAAVTIDQLKLGQRILVDTPHKYKEGIIIGWGLGVNKKPAGPVVEFPDGWITTFKMNQVIKILS